MLRSMYSGISGMRVNQTKLDVIGNNIANVGTTAFKVSRVRFQDMLSQNAGKALGPALNTGGINPRQVGLGVQLAGIDTVVYQGMMQPTSRNLDMAVDGEGYFMVAKGPVAFTKDDAVEIHKDGVSKDEIANGKKLNIMYSRDGSFTLDTDGNLLTSDGYRVLGYSVKGFAMDGTTETESVADDGRINFVDADSKDATTGDSSLKVVTGDNDSPLLKTLRIPEKVLVDATATPPKEARIISFTVEKDGLIKGVLEGGKVAVLGQVAMASFKNPAGLEKMGGNLYLNSANSGAPVVRNGIGTPAAESNSKGYGDMLQGMLEMSNVDLAEQFTDMIVASRAFQASGKMISTGDEILQDIINLKR